MTEERGSKKERKTETDRERDRETDGQTDRDTNTCMHAHTQRLGTM